MSSHKSGGVQCSAVFFLLVWSFLVSSCSGYVKWIYPNADNNALTFNYIDTVYFTWMSSIPDPYMNLWCAPNDTSPQSKTYVYHSQTSTNGTSPQSFPYSEYSNNGICHMQLENFYGDDYANTPTFGITSNDAVAPHTWGLSAISLLGGGSNSAAIASSSSTRVSSTGVATALSLASSSSYLTLSSEKASPAISPASTVSEAPAPHTPTSPSSETVNTAAKAGISIGSIFCALALIITILLTRNAWLRRTRGKTQDLSSFGPSQPQILQKSAEIGEGVYHEINGLARPSELHGTPRAELDWVPRVELDWAPRVELGSVSKL